MSDYFTQIIAQSNQIYDAYKEEYQRFNRLMIGFSAGAIAFMGSMFAAKGESMSPSPFIQLHGDSLGNLYLAKEFREEFQPVRLIQVLKR